MLTCCRIGLARNKCGCLFRDIADLGPLGIQSDAFPERDYLCVGIGGAISICLGVPADENVLFVFELVGIKSRCGLFLDCLRSSCSASVIGVEYDCYFFTELLIKDAVLIT